MTDQKTTGASLALFARLVSVLYSRAFRSLPVPVRQRARVPGIQPDRRTDVEEVSPLWVAAMPDRVWRNLPPTAAKASAPMPSQTGLTAGKSMFRLSSLANAAVAIPPAAEGSKTKSRPADALFVLERTPVRSGTTRSGLKRSIGEGQQLISQPWRLKREGAAGLFDPPGSTRLRTGPGGPAMSAIRMVDASSGTIPPLPGLPAEGAPSVLPVAVTAPRRVGELPSDNSKARIPEDMPVHPRGSAQKPIPAPAASTIPRVLLPLSKPSASREVFPIEASIPPPSMAASLVDGGASLARSVPPAPIPLRGRDVAQAAGAAVQASVSSDQPGMDLGVQMAGNVQMNGRQLGRASAGALARDASLPLATQSRPNIRSTTLYPGMRIPQ